MTAAPISAERVLVPLDGSAFAERVLPRAHWLSERLGACLELVTVAETANGAELARNDLAAMAGIDLVDAIHVELAAQPAEAVDQLAARLSPAVICLATHGRGRSAAVLGSVADAVVRSATLPVVAIGPCGFGVCDPQNGPVIACLDGGDGAAAVVVLAERWAATLGAPLELVTVAEPVPAPERGPVHRHHGRGADPEAWLAEVAATRTSGAVPLSATRAVYDPVDPVEGLLAALRADHARLLVTATHARTGLARLVFGSVAGRLVHHSPVPVALATITR